MDEVTSEYLEKMEENSCFFRHSRKGASSGSKSSEGEEKDNGGNGQEDLCNLMNNNVGIIVPRFEPNEISLETTIGMGEFGVVLKVGTVCLNPRFDNNDTEGEETSEHGSSYGCQRGHRPLNKRSSAPTTIATDGGLSAIDSGTMPPAIQTSRSRSIHEADLDRHGNTCGTITVSRCQQDPNLPFSDAPVLWLSSEQNHVDNIETDRILREELAKTCRRRKSHSSTTTTASSSSSGDPYCDSPTTMLSRAASMELAPRVPSSDVPDNSLLVIKQIRKDLYPKRRIEAAKDLAREAKLLARLQQLSFLESRQSSKSSEQHRYHRHSMAYMNNHPNLITLRGIVSDPGSPDFGILLDRLHLTLAELATSWGKRQMIILENLATTTTSRKHRALPQWGLSPDHLVGALVGITHKVGGWFNGEDHDGSEKFSASAATNNPPHTGSEELGLSEAAAKTKTASPEALLLLGERILALWDVAEGMGHLHCHKILYRDLKTENVGRTVRSRAEGCADFAEGARGNALSSGSQSKLQNCCDHQDQQRMQIFDFGLAKECKRSDRIPSESPNTSTAALDTGGHTTDAEDASGSGGGGCFYDNYKMTGLTGTMRIMAPEVIQCLPYGLPADVYSFGICMWEVFTGTKCNFLSAAEICDTKHIVRPQLPTVFYTENGSSFGMPKTLQTLMQKCWHEDPKKRPDFREISKNLRSILAGLVRQSTSMRPQQHQQQQQQSQQQQHRYEQSSNLSSSSFLSKGMDGRRHPVSPFRSCVTGNGGGGGIGGFWNKIRKTQQRRRQQQQQQQCPRIGADGSLDTTATDCCSSDRAGFWFRLETIRASGLLDD